MSEAVDTPQPQINIFEQALAQAQRAVESINAHLATAATAAQAAGEHEKSAAAAAANAASQRPVIDEAVAFIQGVKTQATSLQAVIAQKSEHIEDARKHADEVRGELDKVLTAATAQATEADSLKTRAQSASDSATTLLAEVQKHEASSESALEQIATARSEAETSAAQLKRLSDKATSVDQTLANYEKRLAQLQEDCALQLKTIVGLLPGATSAGLAHAFDDRRKAFVDPSKKWQWLFIGSVLSLVFLALTGLVHAMSGSEGITYDELGRLWLARLPVAGALIWLALHSSRESALAKRLEEDYAYKSAIASSFQGFQKQMNEIGTAAGADTPLSQLCNDTLATIASPPGRIYEKHALTVSVSDQVKDAMKEVMAMAKRSET